jgi:hypothetical protein
VAIISRELGYLFIHVPRTGGTALTQGVLVPHLKGEQLPRMRVEVKVRKGQFRLVRQHITKRQLLDCGLLRPEEAAELLTFATIRNPFDVMVSAYVKKRDVVAEERWARDTPRNVELLELARTRSFTDYLAAAYGEDRTQRLIDAHLDGVDVVLRFERLQEDFDGVLDRLGVGQHLEIPHQNVTAARARDYRSYYTPEARAIVERVFADDLERFGYEF